MLQHVKPGAGFHTFSGYEDDETPPGFGGREIPKPDDTK